MEERFVPPAVGEAPLPNAKGSGPGSDASAAGLHDPRALQILTTEHWSLLSARSLVYNEAFARAGMFLAFLSATLLVLGLISTATGFSGGFLTVAAIVLSLDLFVGLASLGRISSASFEDIRYLQGMSRIRHAYFELVPGTAPYFITSGHDDPGSVLAFYGSRDSYSPVGGLLHGLTTTPGMVGAICAAIAGALGGVLTLLATHDAVVAGAVALAVLVGAFGVITAIAMRAVARLMGSLEVRFPAPPSGPRQPTPPGR